MIFPAWCLDESEKLHKVEVLLMAKHFAVSKDMSYAWKLVFTFCVAVVVFNSEAGHFGMITERHRTGS